MIVSTVGCGAAGGAGTGAPESGNLDGDVQERPREVLDGVRAEVVSVAEATLAALSAADTATLRRIMHPTARLLSLSEDPSVAPRVTQVEQFLASVGGPEAPLLERMWSPTVHVDGRLATVWTPYDFYRGGEFSHCGTDVFTLGYEKGTWRVLGIAYTVQREGCPESPLGPPA